MSKIEYSRKILLCLRYGIGDLVMEMPVIETLRRVAPSAYIQAIGAEPAIELLEGTPWFDEVFSIQHWGLEHWGDAGTAEIRTRIRNWMEKQGHDLILDPSHAVIAARDIIWERDVLIMDSRNGIIEPDGPINGVEAIKRSVLAGWGMEIPRSALPRMELNPEEVKAAEAGLRDRTGMLYAAALSVVASSPLKRWPIERFASLADRIIEKTGCPVLIFYGPQQDVIEEMLARMSHPEKVVTIGDIHLRQVAALLAMCSVLVCNDTGLMHVAAAVGTPPVAVFGPTHHRIYLPPVDGATAVYGHNDQCPYRKKESFGHPECVVKGRCLIRRDGCITDVGVEPVWEAVEGFLEKVAGSGNRVLAGSVF